MLENLQHSKEQLKFWTNVLDTRDFPPRNRAMIENIIHELQNKISVQRSLL